MSGAKVADKQIYRTGVKFVVNSDRFNDHETTAITKLLYEWYVQPDMDKTIGLEMHPAADAVQTATQPAVAPVHPMATPEAELAAAAPELDELKAGLQQDNEDGYMLKMFS